MLTISLWKEDKFKCHSPIKSPKEQKVEASAVIEEAEVVSVEAAVVSAVATEVAEVVSVEETEEVEVNLLLSLVTLVSNLMNIQLEVSSPTADQFLELELPQTPKLAEAKDTAMLTLTLQKL